MLKEYLKIHWIIITVLLFPLISFAQVSEVACSKSGYTVATINGIFTKEGSPDDSEGAEANRIAVKRLFSTKYKGENLTFEYLYNPTHGLLDLSDVAIQKTFEGVDMQDPDFLNMLTNASTQIKTQKLLLVAHSQGNFYANNFYNTVTTNGDISPKSIGVYGVGSPAKEVAGSGEYLTSSTDTVINKVRKVLHGTVLKANDWIEYKETDDSGRGHGFREIYLNYRGEEIKKGIEESLARLSANPNRSEDIPCVTSPRKRTTIGKVSHVIDYSAQFAVASGVTAVTANSNSAVDNFIKKAPSVIFATWRTYDNTVAVAIWVRTTTIAVGNGITDTVMAIGSFAKNAFTGLLSGGPISVDRNSASVILATIPMQDLPKANVSDNNAITIDATASIENQASVAGTQQQPQTVFVFEPKVQAGTNIPKLVFVGSFSGGLAGAQVMGTQSTAPVAPEVVVVEEKIADNAGGAMATPVLSAPQCSQTLATDGCLLATTTVHFEWPDVAGADHYLLNKNGEYATTTDTIFDTEIKDFSDYIFEVVAVGVDGNASATSTQAVSVATIPIAINEIAWIGTRANTSDEWFEIKNNTGHTIDLSQWELNAKDNTPYVKLAGTIAPHAYLIFERTDDTAVKDVDMHQKFTGELENNGDQLVLSYASTTMDQTPDGAWPAGATSTRQTMERYSSREPGVDPENWGTNLGYIKNGTDAKDNAIEGTPGEQNSVSTLINKGQDITSDYTLTADEERYVIANVLRISASSTLTIETGVEIKFYDGWINVHGHLAVAGTKENPVIIDTFSGNQEGGISVGGGYTDSGYRGVNASTTLDYVNIKNINYINAYDNTRLDISNMNLLNSTGGIYAQDTAQISIASSSIRDTQDNHAVAVYENSQITIASSTITNTIDNDAVGVYNGTMAITNTTIDGATDNGGIFVSRGTLSIASSTIKNVSESGISLLRATSTISDVVIENAGWTGIEIYRGDTTIASTTISDITGWAGVYVGEGVLSISSSTIKNVAEYGIYTYKATSTISNVTIENGGSNGVDIDQGAATITDTSVSGFTYGAGISVTNPTETVQISGGEITGNAIGIDVYPNDSAIITDVSVHDNGTSEAAI